MTDVVAETDQNEAAAPADTKPYRVLSLVDGGMRGIYTVAFVDRLVTQFARTRGEECLDLGKAFDLITRAGTGAIAASALAIGRPMGEIVKLYRDHGRQIFSHRIKDTLSAIRCASVESRYMRQGDTMLRKALTDVLRGTTMLDIFRKRGISLSIPAVAISNDRSWVFKKTPASGVRDDHYTLVEVCMASSKPPIFRSVGAVRNPKGGHRVMQVFANGGLWADNPIMVGLVDALVCAPKDAPIEIISLDTCSRAEGELIPPRQVHRPIPGWEMDAKASYLSITAQELAFDNITRFLGNKFTELGRPHPEVPFSQRGRTGRDAAVSGARRRPPEDHKPADPAGEQ